MKKLLAVGLLGLTQLAHAQSNVTMYGLLDTGITYVNNTGGHPKLYEDVGVMNGNRWGLRGAEDLGGGNQAVFVLENGFNVGTGALGNGGALFGRQAYVGLSSKSLGTVTLGRQVDLMIDMFYYADAGYQGFYAAHPLDFDRLSGEQAVNSVKYVSPSYSGVSISALYGFSNAAGAFGGTAGAARVVSFDAKFEGHGPLALIGAYTKIDGTGAPGTLTTAEDILGATAVRSYGFGARYSFKDAGAVYASVTNSLATGMAGGAHASGTFVDAGVLYPVTRAFFISPSVTWGKVIGDPYAQFNLLLDYFLSKRTDLYAGAFYQKSMSAARGAGMTDIISFSTLNAGDSTTNKQLAFRIGIRSRF